MHNNLLHSLALNISCSLLSAAELQDGIAKQPTTYLHTKTDLDSTEWQILREVAYPELI